MKDVETEKIQEEADYRGHLIYFTSWGRYLVVTYGICYPAPTLDCAKKIIDDLFEVRKN